MSPDFYTPEYTSSWALVIGINKYQEVSPLSFARSDAEAVAQLLVEKFDFPAVNVALLVDDSATREAILARYLEFTQDKIAPNDRVLVFFAGHGYTHTGHRGEVGFLIPTDGNPDNLASLIRWDDLTRNSELIPAKHMLFIMDACYGGLALSRALLPGSMRFLKDMLKRYSRQVLTAGKGNELVLDSGGPLPGHSMFTGHFIQALQGGAATGDEIITANGVMSYVYERVAKDYQSRQTPHYGFFDGDGDFIFRAPVLSKLFQQSQPQTDTDYLVTIPIPSADSTSTDTQLGLVDKAKEYLSDARCRIKLNDLVLQKSREVIPLLSDEHFPVDARNVTAEEVADRLRRYEVITQKLQTVYILLCHWGVSEHISIIKNVLSRVIERDGSRSGMVAWLNLRYYPSILLMYSGGIGAIAAANYASLAAVLTTKVGSAFTSDNSQEAVLEVGHAMLELERANVFRLLPDHTKHFVPRSEYLFKRLQPQLDDLLFLGKSYEAMFDRFEIMLALVHADLLFQSTNRVWGPFGRFAWKHRSGDFSIYTSVLKEAQVQQDAWPPLRAGLFGGSFERFNEIAKAYEQQIHDLGWY
ncbi:MAG: caspase family protein [Chloroflexi bacterium]|nr:caspase family protein [Chloroflexota bacterium]